MPQPLCVVLGVGPGLGTAIARRFGKEGYQVAIGARSFEHIQHIESILRADGFTTHPLTVDLSDTHAISDTLTFRAGCSSGHR